MTLQQAAKAALRACRPDSMGFSSRLAGTFQFPDVSDDRPPAAKQRALGLCAALAYDVCECSLNSADVAWRMFAVDGRRHHCRFVNLDRA
ncbi:hypothetical protein GPL21_09820 [Bradyrhizobium pachyrhizi]|uniref:Uncharacterized protein n=1 Tax=Bradyrhizobium pachyrhizi TaxID=280333 RepID=A0A844SPU4_9BRAD|nr:hypothetical protein [Bradyrhizobium pachyrhizi]MVT65402.1 hypothetical protein [Bradyrhizobium pachyrhizi]